MSNYINKNKLTKIDINSFVGNVPELKNIKESKSVVIGKWLSELIKSALKTDTIKPNSLLPSKSEFAYLLGVSIGTMQNALRYVEDLGYIESKQCIGTIVRDRKKNNATMRKLTSKREIAIEKIKAYIMENNFAVGFQLPSSRVISKITGCSQNTTRLALEYLCTHKILIHKFKNSSETGWIVNKVDFELRSNCNNETLVTKILSELKDYIRLNLQTGDRIPPHGVLSRILNVSPKTLHDALKTLVDEGVLLPKRGRYGTTVIKMPDEMTVEQRYETSIFAPASETAFYYYEKTQNYIKKMIAEKFSIGQKLPSVNDLSKQMDLSPNTVRRAFHNLAKEGYLVFSRGRYGGTFVIDIPELEENAFKWLAVNPKYAEVYKN